LLFGWSDAARPRGRRDVKVYILFGYWDYEGSEVLAVYSAKKDAEAALAKLEARQEKSSHDGFSVGEYELLSGKDGAR
jgi:hypothetical protein